MATHRLNLVSGVPSATNGAPAATVPPLWKKQSVTTTENDRGPCGWFTRWKQEGTGCDFVVDESGDFIDLEA